MSWGTAQEVLASTNIEAGSERERERGGVVDFYPTIIREVHQLREKIKGSAGGPFLDNLELGELHVTSGETKRMGASGTGKKLTR